MSTEVDQNQAEEEETQEKLDAQLEALQKYMAKSHCTVGEVKNTQKDLCFSAVDSFHDLCCSPLK